jgi:hypothetical protein
VSKLDVVVSGLATDLPEVPGEMHFHSHEAHLTYLLGCELEQQGINCTVRMRKRA